MSVLNITGDTGGESESVNPDVIYSQKNAKVKGNLTKVQTVILADVEASERAMSCPRKTNILLEMSTQRVEFSRALHAHSTEKYVDAVKSRLIAEDRKQLVMTRNDDGTI